MIEHTYSLYKLIILEMLSRVNCPMSASQFADFIVGKEYTNYFHLQEVITDMVDSGLLSVSIENRISYYRATKQGEDTLRFFGKEIHADIREEIGQYILDNHYELRNASSVQANYKWLSGQGYEVRCIVKEGSTTLIDLRLIAETEEIARTLCNNWYTKNAEAYASLMGILLTDN